MAQFRTISLPEDLCVEADKWMTGQFDTLESFVAFLLQQIVKDDSSKFEQAEEAIVEERLRELGYL